MMPSRECPPGGIVAWIRERPVLFTVLFVACCLLRLVALGDRPIMHDEALFTYYTYEQYYKTLTYDYMPILHGPAHLILQTIIWHIFGATDWTMRLQPALLGIAGFFWIVSLRPWLGRTGTWFAAAFYTLSPGIGFFQRFYREDGLFLFTTLWMCASAAHWWRSRNPRWLGSFVFATTVLFCNKESSLFVYFSFATFAALLLVVDLSQWLFDGKDTATPTAEIMRGVPRFPAAWICALIAGGFVMLCVVRIFEGIKYDEDVVQAIGHDFALANVRSIPLLLGWEEPVQNAGAVGTPRFWRVFYFGLFAGAFAVFALAKFIVDRRIGHREFGARLWENIHRARWQLLAALAGSFVLYLAIFTTFFTRPMGPFEIYRKTWTYWGGQHEWGRIAGPFHLHSVNLLIYELPAVLIVVAAWLWGLARRRWTRASGVGLFLVLLPLAAFHVLIFKGVEWLPPDGSAATALNVTYCKTLLMWGLLLVIGVMAYPRAARFAVPIALVLMAAYSFSYFEAEPFTTFRSAQLLRGGSPLTMAAHQVTGAESMEIQLNMDAGWNLLYVMLLVFFAVVMAWRAIEEGRRFHAFLIWWFVTSLGAASYAREAVPQVGIHAALPMILLAASHVERLSARGIFMRMRAVWVTLLAIAILWNAKSTIMLNFHNGGSAAERMAYCPTGTELRDQARFVADWSARSSLKHKPVPRANGMGELDEWLEYYNDPMRRRDVRVLVKGDSIWALRWYLRDTPWTEFGDVSSAILDKYEFLFVEPTELEKQPLLAETYNISYGRVRTFWTPDPLSLSKLSDLWLGTIPAHDRQIGSDEANRLADARAEWRRLWRYLMFREPFDGDGRQYPSLSASYYLFCVRKDLAP